MESDNKLPALPNSAFLALSGGAILLARQIILWPPARLLIAAGAIGWGFYLLGREPYNKTPGWTSIAAGGALALFGGLLAGVSWIAGVGLIAAGVVSFVSGLFNRGDRR
jgi:hypothetical protein